VLLLAIVYFSAPQKVLAWIGGIGLLPFTLILILSRELTGTADWNEGNIPARILAYGLPLGVAFLLRGRLAWVNGVAAVWVFVTTVLTVHGADRPMVYFWCGLGAAGLVAWGMYEHRTERINFGMAGFGITVLCFYFSSVMDKLGRSESLIGLGALFLAGGWALENLRRRLVARMRESA
jgi:hypothetical protein